MLGKKIYIASPIRLSSINRVLFNIISNELNLEVFLPESLNIEDSKSTIRYIANKCYNEIDSSQIMLVVAPYGLSTSAEIGYAIYRKRKFDDITIVMYRSDKFNLRLEAAITPYIDHECDSLEDLKIIINNID